MKENAKSRPLFAARRPQYPCTCRAGAVSGLYNIKEKPVKSLKNRVQTLKIESGRCEMFRTPAFSVLQYLKVPVVQNKV